MVIGSPLWLLRTSRRMSAMGQKQTSHHVRVMSVIPPQSGRFHVRLVPAGEIGATSGARRYDRRPWHHEPQRYSGQFYCALVFAA